MTQEERIARARAALARAELRTGARSLAHQGPSDATRGTQREHGEAVRAGRAVRLPVVQGTAALAVAPVVSPAAPVVSPAGPVVAPEIAPESPTGPVAVPDLPDRTAPARPWSPSAGRSTVARGPLLLTDRPPLAVPPALTPLLPDGLRRGSTTAVLGSTSLALAMIAAACTAREAWAAVVGQPGLGLLAAAQTGIALERLAVVPRPGVDAPTVIAALLDGIDVVVVGPGTTLTDSDRRRLMARARDRGSVLLSTAPWPGAGCVLSVEGGRWSGVGDGDGRLRAHELHITRTGRGAAGGRVRDLRVVLPLEPTTDPYGLPVEAAPAGQSEPAARVKTGGAATQGGVMVQDEAVAQDDADASSATALRLVG